MKKLFLLMVVVNLSFTCFAQDEDEEKKGGFKKENLFTGGSISLAFYNNTFLAGVSPVLGYSITKWADAGVVVNFNYTSYRDYQGNINDKLRQYVYGGGAFVKLYPVNFLFVQAQPEYNFMRWKYIQAGSTYTEIFNDKAGSFLIGGGYTSGRSGDTKQPFYYLSLLFDVSGNRNSPYTDNLGRSIPIIRGGLQFPLFQGNGKRERR